LNHPFFKRAKDNRDQTIQCISSWVSTTLQVLATVPPPQLCVGELLERLLAHLGQHHPPGTQRKQFGKITYKKKDLDTKIGYPTILPSNRKYVECSGMRSFARWRLWHGSWVRGLHLPARAHTLKRTRTYSDICVCVCVCVY
jgi:hypothetical protein